MSEDKKVPKRYSAGTNVPKFNPTEELEKRLADAEKRLTALENPKNPEASIEDFTFTRSHWSWLKQCMDLMFRSRKMPMPKPPK